MERKVDQNEVLELQQSSVHLDNEIAGPSTKTDEAVDGQNAAECKQANKNTASRRSLTPLPPLMDVPEAERENLLIEKLRQCCVLLDFTCPPSDLVSEVLKRSALLDLIEYFEINEMQDKCYPEFFKMVSKNLFRTLPPYTKPSGPEFAPEPDDPFMDINWQHMHLVYLLFLQFLESPTFQLIIAQHYIDKKFLQQLLNLFDSEIGIERELLEVVLYRIYQRCSALRENILMQIQYVFYGYIYENERHNGIAELLAILCTVIPQFKSPLNVEHKQLLLNAMMPLHKMKNLSLYHPQLTLCIKRFIKKDSDLTGPVIKSLLRFWPKTDSKKEMLFVEEVRNILEIIEPIEFRKIMIPTFRKIANCATSQNSSVAETVFYCWKSGYIRSLIMQNLTVILPILFPPLNINSKIHWNKKIRFAICETLKILRDMNQQLYFERQQYFKLEQQSNQHNAK